MMKTGSEPGLVDEHRDEATITRMLRATSARS